MLEPIETKDILPDHCTCGHLDIDPQSIKPFYTHQHIELPEIKLDVTHFILNRGKCKCCGKTVKASVPSQFSSGYGPRLSAVISELSGSHGASIETAQDFCQSVLGLPISTGGIQRVIDRASAAINPIYHAFADPAREQFDEAILKKLQLLFHGAKTPRMNNSGPSFIQNCCCC